MTEFEKDIATSLRQIAAGIGREDAMSIAEALLAHADATAKQAEAIEELCNSVERVSRDWFER